MNRILLVEDELQVSTFIKRGLNEEQYEVDVANNGLKGLDMALSGNYNLVILDIMLPGMNGLEVCRRIRSFNRSMPILFLTALGTPENVVIGLEAEADDYLVKPFKFIELLARVRNLLRRQALSPIPEDEASATFRFADIEVNDSTKSVLKTGKPISLTSTEYKLLLYFIRNPKRVLSRTEILENVWGVNFDMGTNVVDVYVNYLRNKIDKPFDRKLIQTVVGMGYVMRDDN